MNHKSDLKHTSTTKSRDEEQENEAWDKLKAADCELQMVKEELQITKDELKEARGELRVVRVE